MRLFLFISREKATVASRNVGISAKYVIKIYAFGSAHVKFSVWVTASLSAVVFPAEPIQFWILIETSTPIDPHEINLYWIWFGLCEIRLLNQAKSNIDVLRKSVRFFIKKYFILENGRSVERLHPRRMELANILSEWLRNPGSWNPKKIPGEACPRTPLETYPFGARLENRSCIYPRIRSWDL